MQALFALKHAETSNYHHAHEYFKELFAPDLNSMEVQDHPQLQANILEATNIFNENYLAERAVIPETQEVIKKAVLNALATYHNKNKKDQKFYCNQMVDYAEKLSQNYILLLQYAVEVIHFVDSVNESKKSRLANGTEVVYTNKLSSNKLVQLLENDHELSLLKVRYGSAWERDIIKNSWNEFAENDSEYATYLHNPKPTFEEDKNILLHLIKVCVFKNQVVQDYLENLNMFWAEDKSILKSLVTRTIKSIEEDTIKITLLDISSNWKDDKDFFINLYEQTVEHDKALEALVGARLQNWDHERIANTDKIILNMALCEMIHFPSIPTKVTINEYIEICKDYSTPKSKQFVNGILDKLATDLVADGTIRKSGRGLLDNKS